MKTWEIKVTEETGKVSFTRCNTGFTAFELLGILDYMKDEIIRQIHGEAQSTIQSKATRILDPECDAPHFEEITSSDEYKNGIRFYKPTGPVKYDDLTYYERQIVDGQLPWARLYDPDSFIAAN